MFCTYLLQLIIHVIIFIATATNITLCDKSILAFVMGWFSDDTFVGKYDIVAHLKKMSQNYA